MHKRVTFLHIVSNAPYFKLDEVKIKVFPLFFLFLCLVLNLETSRSVDIVSQYWITCIEVLHFSWLIGCEWIDVNLYLSSRKAARSN